MKIKSIITFRLLAILYFFILILPLSAQPILVVDTIYLQNVPIHKVRSSYNGEIWFMDKNPSPQLYRINRRGILQNRTIEFADQIESGITDFVCPDTNELVVGTNNNFAFYYKQGTIHPLGVNQGLKDVESHINSVFLRRDVSTQFGNTWHDYMEFGIATNGGAYKADSIMESYEDISGYGFPVNVKFISKDDPYLLKYDYNGSPKIRFYHSDGIHEYNVDQPAEAGDILCGNIMHYGGSDIRQLYLGFQKGLVAMTFYYSYRYLTSQSIHAIANLTINDVLIAADSGLYYANSLLEPVKIDIGIDNYTAYDIEINNGNIHVATNIGLIQLINTNCFSYSSFFDQDKQYADFESGESISFIPRLSDGTNTWRWDFGDGASSIERFPHHQYEEEGNFHVSLITENGFCTDTSYSLAVAYKKSKLNETGYIMNTGLPFDEEGEYSYGVNLADLNGDLEQELFLPPTAILKFVNADSIIIQKFEFESLPRSVVIGDLNNDGLNEIIAGTEIYINQGNFTFQLKRINYDFTMYSTLKYCLLDFNNDGWLDIALAVNEKFALYLNKGDFNFEKIQNIFDDERNITAIKWIDIDNDDDNDLLITGSYYRNNSLYINEKGTYVKSFSGMFPNMKTDNLIFGDLNNDRRLDLYMNYEYENFLYVSRNDSFVICDQTWLTNERNLHYKWQYVFLNSSLSDFDNNGYLDCIKNAFDNRIIKVFMNYGNLIFKDDENSPFNQSAFQTVNNVISSDISSDGYPDIFLSGVDQYPKPQKDYLFLNKGTTNNWVKIKCVGSQSNYNAIGTKVFVKSATPGSWQYRFIESPNTIEAQNGYDIHFGLGASEILDSIEILWTSGKRSIFTNLDVNKTYTIVEPLIKYWGDTVICENVTPLFQMPQIEDVSYDWFMDHTLIAHNTNNLKITKPGKYKCIIHYPDLTDSTATITISHKAVSTSEIVFEGDSIFCPEDSSLISSLTYAGARYTWLINGIIDTNQIESFIYATDTFSFQQIIINNVGCSDTSNILTPKNFPSPLISLNETYSLCMGDSMEISVDTLYSEYIWSNGDTTASTVLHSTDWLSVKVWNEFHCLSEDTVHKVVWPLPYVELGKDTVIGYNEYLVIGACNSGTYTYMWNDSIEDCFRVFNGTELNIGHFEFSIIVTNQYNCISYDTLSIDVILYSGSEILKDNNLVIFPNPTDGKIKLYINSELIGPDTRIEVYNLNGELIDKLNVSIQQPQVIEYEFRNGIMGNYILRVVNDNHMEQQKIQLLRQ